MKKKVRTLWKNHRCINVCNCDCHQGESPLKPLKLKPLSIAKYFWKKGIDDYALIQDFIYLTYIEALWKNVLLFEEKYQAWEEGPVLISVYQKMRGHYKNHGELDGLFSKTEDVKDKVVKTCLTKVYRDYQNNKKKGKEIDFFFQVQDTPWELAREKSIKGKRTSTLEPRQIMASVK